MSCTWLTAKQGEIAKQTSLARRLTTIDSWGMTMTVVTTIIGLGLAHGVSVSSLGKPAIPDLTIFTA